MRNDICRKTSDGLMDQYIYPVKPDMHKVCLHMSSMKEDEIGRFKDMMEIRGYL